MEVLIQVVIFVFILISAERAAKKKQEKRGWAAKPNQIRTAQTKPNQSRTSEVRLNQPRKTMAKNKAYEDWVKRSTKHTSTRSYNTNKTSGLDENQILNRAKQNAQSNAQKDNDRAQTLQNVSWASDEKNIIPDYGMEQHIHHTNENLSNDLKNQAGVDDLDTYHMIDEINDLIVKGYSGNLEFERDFLAEGMDMLNRTYQYE